MSVGLKVYKIMTDITDHNLLNQPLKVGFLLNVSEKWMGGLNYMKNLLYALKLIEHKDIKPLLFVSKKINKNIKSDFEELATVIEVSFLTPYSFKWLLWKGIKRITGSNILVELYLKKYKIVAFSHSDLIGLKKAKSLNRRCSV